MKSGRLGTPDMVAHIRQFPPVEYELASYQGSPWLWADGKPLIDLLDATSWGGAAISVPAPLSGARGRDVLR